MTETKETVLPYFPGFYESPLSWMIDREEESMMECEDKTYEEIEDQVDYRRGYLAIAQEWLDVFAHETGIKLKYKEVVSPREYNFTTDRLFADIEGEEVQRIRDVVEKERETFVKVLEELFTSRSGFYSFYSNAIEDYLEKPTEDLDCNEIMAYIKAYVDIEHDADELLERIHDTSCVYEAAQQIWI